MIFLNFEINCYLWVDKKFNCFIQYFPNCQLWSGVRFKGLAALLVLLDQCETLVHCSYRFLTLATVSKCLATWGMFPVQSKKEKRVACDYLNIIFNLNLNILQ